MVGSTTRLEDLKAALPGGGELAYSEVGFTTVKGERIEGRDEDGPGRHILGDLHEGMEVRDQRIDRRFDRRVDHLRDEDDADRPQNREELQP